jgi:hypothetical protein
MVRIPLVQIVLWGQPADEAVILSDSCGGGALHRSEVYAIGVGTQSGHAFEGFLVIKKICSCFFLHQLKLVLYCMG